MGPGWGKTGVRAGIGSAAQGQCRRSDGAGPGFLANPPPAEGVSDGVMRWVGLGMDRLEKRESGWLRDRSPCPDRPTPPLTEAARCRAKVMRGLRGSAIVLKSPASALKNPKASKLPVKARHGSPQMPMPLPDKMNCLSRLRQTGGP